MEAVIGMKGKYVGQIIRKGTVIDEFDIENLVVDQGLNYALNSAFGKASALANWYIGLFEGNYTPTSGVDASTIATLSSECTGYSSATRPAWSLPGVTITKQLTNGASRASFTFTASKTLYGAFLISSNVKGGTAGTLFSAARFSTPKSVDADDELLITYILTAADA